MEILSFMGENTWGIVPASFRSFLFWLVIVTCCAIFAFCAWGLLKTTSNGEVTAINKERLIWLLVISCLLLLFALLRTVGGIVFEKWDFYGGTTQRVVLAGHEIDVGDTTYKCTKKRYVNVFVTQGQDGETTKGGTMTVISPRSSIKVPTWWEEQEHKRQDTKIYTCGG